MVSKKNKNNFWSKIKNVIVRVGDFFAKHPKLTIIIIISLLAIRLWWYMSMNWWINVDTYYDSRLELNTAVDMVSGHWAGAYGKATLCKGLSFPLFLAWLLFFQIPYPVGLFLITVLSAFVFARSLKPLIKSKGARWAIFFFILYSPVGMGGGAVYPYRNALAPWVILIVVACILAIYLRRRAEIKKLLPWALTGLFFTGFFWNLREDSMWFLPFIIIGCGIIIFQRWLETRKKKKIKFRKKIAFLTVVLCPVVGILVWNTGLSVINNMVYGVYTPEDRTKTYAAKVLGALIRIDDGADLENDYWVSNGALDLAKQVSPTLAQMNLNAFDMWRKNGDYSIWALRDAAEASGFYVDAKETNENYRKIYEELEQGFKNGTLKRKNGIQLSDTSGLYSFNEVLRPIGISFKSLINHVTHGEYMANDETILSVRNENDLEFYESVLGIRLVRSDAELEEITADRKMIQSNNFLKKELKLNKYMTNVLRIIYDIISWIMFIGATIGFVLMGYRIFRKKDRNNFIVEMSIMMIGLILTILLYGYLVGLWGIGYELTADSDLFQGYTTPITILVYVFEIIGIYYFINLIKDYLTSRFSGKTS